MKDLLARFDLAVAFDEIPKHEHTHSLYTHCLDCFMFGTDTPKRFNEASCCGNCGSLQTVKYYPSCCIVEDRARLQPILLAVRGCLSAMQTVVGHEPFIGLEPRPISEALTALGAALDKMEGKS